MSLDKNDSGLRARILQQRQVLKGPMVPKSLVLGVEVVRSPDPSSLKARIRQSRDDSPSEPRRVGTNFPIDPPERFLGKKKVGEGSQGERSPLRKKSRGNDESEEFMVDARKCSWQVKSKSRADTLPMKHHHLDVPEFLSDYVEDMLRFVDLKANTGNFSEGEFEGELEMLAKGAKSSMMLVSTYVLSTIFRISKFLDLSLCFNSH